MSKIRAATVTAAPPNRIRVAKVESVTPGPGVRIRAAKVTAGIPTGPAGGMFYVYNGTDWTPTTLFAYTGEDVVEAPAPTGWRRVALTPA